MTPDTGKIGEYVTFDTYHSSDETKRDWYLTIFPKGEKEEDKDFLSVFLWIAHEVPVRVQCKISVIDQTGSEKHTDSLDRIFSPDTGHGWPRLVPRDLLFNLENGLLDNGNLTFAVEIQFDKVSKFATDDSALHSSIKLQQICRNKFFTDVTIKVQGKSIEAHKFLLAESSLVLYSRMLLHKNQNILELDGLDFEVVQEMINFIYEDRVLDLKKNVDALLTAALQYKMERLRKYCEKYLYENLTTENALATLKVAKKGDRNVDRNVDRKKCADKELREECINFIAK